MVFLVYYNYLKPHHSLKGKTPAEVAKVDYKSKNWGDVIRLPSSKKINRYEHNAISEAKPILVSKSMPRITPPSPRISERRGRLLG